MMKHTRTLILAMLLAIGSRTLLASAEAPAKADAGKEAAAKVAPAAKITGEVAVVKAAGDADASAQPVYVRMGKYYPLMIPALLGIILVLLLYVRQLQNELKAAAKETATE